MVPFWAMSDTDKTLLVLKILFVGFGWGLLIVGAIAVMCLFMLLVQDRLNILEERREKRRKESQTEPFSPTTDPQVTAFKVRQTRRRLRAEHDEFFRNVQELHDDLR